MENSLGKEAFNYDVRRNTNLKIVFMGTPQFALVSLEAILHEGHEILAVVTQPDKPKGRKYKLTPPPVKIFAKSKNIEVLQPKKIRNGEITSILKGLLPDLIVVCAYGKIIPPDILTLPKYGCVNVHASLLPKYKGAAPIAWSIVNGEKKNRDNYHADGRRS